MNNTVIFCQKKFPFITKRFELDSDKGKIKIFNKSLFKSNETEVPIHAINENNEKVRKSSLGWIIAALIFLGLFIFSLSSWIWSPPKLEDDKATEIIKQFFAFVTVAYLWFKSVSESYNLTFHINKFNNQVLFFLYTNNPDKVAYGKFTEALANAIENANQKNTLIDILTNIPTHILVNEFGSSYINELMKRDIDMQAMMQFLTKKVSLLKNNHLS